jgi:hypothetical protein
MKENGRASLRLKHGDFRSSSRFRLLFEHDTENRFALFRIMLGVGLSFRVP